MARALSLGLAFAGMVAVAAVTTGCGSDKPAANDGSTTGHGGTTGGAGTSGSAGTTGAAGRGGTTGTGGGGTIGTAGRGGTTGTGGGGTPGSAGRGGTTATGGRGGTTGSAGTTGGAGTTGAGGGGTQPIGAVCVNNGNCSQADGTAVCCLQISTCVLATQCPTGTTYVSCENQPCTKAGWVCCNSSGMHFCTKQSACSN